MSDSIETHLRTPSGLVIGLSQEEARLALLGLVDFEGCWDSLRAATAFIADGAAKDAVIRSRLLPLTDYLPALLDGGIDSLEMLAARYWFRSGPCTEIVRLAGAESEPEPGETAE
jgi:hypothetical protein